MPGIKQYIKSIQLSYYTRLFQQFQDFLEFATLSPLKNFLFLRFYEIPNFDPSRFPWFVTLSSLTTL